MKFQPSDTVSGLKPSGIRRFFDLQHEMGDEALSLSIGEPDFVTPWEICEAAIESFRQGQTHYTPNSGLSELREAIASYLSGRLNVSYDPAKEILVTVGGSEAIDIAIRASINPGDHVLLPEPSFVAYRACVELVGGVVQTVKTTMADEFKVTVPALEAAWTPETKMIILAYPNNPTGAAMTREDWLPVIRWIEEKDLLVIADELYIELTYDDLPIFSFASLPGMYERTCLIGGFSKSFAMTGWRIGYAAGPQEWLAAMTKIHQYAIMSSPTNAQYAAIIALDNAEHFVKPMRDQYIRRRDYLLSRLHGMGLPCCRAQGAFYLFPDISAFGLSSGEFCERFLEEQKVAIVPGTAFDEDADAHVRICYAASMENLETAMDRLEQFIQSLK